MTSPGLRIHNLDLNREQWDNVPSLVTKSFHIVQTNMLAVKKWSDKQEDRMKFLSDSQDALRAEVEAANATLEASQASLRELEERLASLDARQTEERDLFALSMQKLLAISSQFWYMFGDALGVLAPELAVPEEVLSSVVPEPKALAELSRGLDARLGPLTDCFASWTGWRNKADEERQQLRGEIAQLSLASERTKERMLAWREMLRESSHAVDALSNALCSAQADVKQLQVLQVRQEYVDSSVAEMARQVDAQGEARLSAGMSSLEAHVVDVEAMVTALQRNTSEAIEDHSTRVGALLEGSLSPVNAYLNSMHVRVDTLRADVDLLSVAVPRLQTRHDETRAQLQRCEEETKKADGELSGRIDDLGTQARESVTAELERSAAAAETVETLRRDLSTELSGLGASLMNARSDIERIRAEELAGVARELSILEQKVAKWIHAHPLPAKISEARLYALEARLAEETDARLLFEETVKSGSAIGNNPLPPLQNREMASMIAPGSGRRRKSIETVRKASVFE
eukprot:TRINITY_DN22723_c1_g5_i1.p1 TRINITY_DN22723_c1_g5~~TRINITY_DN22723_c1_g5_i1.p1  ORF type:complete len:518 (-),score=145.83 TRINITY_DN22723_c1_g5_i1:74-1627(-)